MTGDPTCSAGDPASQSLHPYGTVQTVFIYLLFYCILCVFQGLLGVCRGEERHLGTQTIGYKRDLDPVGSRLFYLIHKGLVCEIVLNGEIAYINLFKTLFQLFQLLT